MGEQLLLDIREPIHEPITVDSMARRYRDLNRAWFDGKLRRVTFRISTRMTITAGQYDIGRREIAVAARYLDAHPDGLDTLLLHEMVHVAAPRAGHGPAFRREWARLLESGAPVPETYGEFRHCPSFTPAGHRRFTYRCPVCTMTFGRMRPFHGPRWCGACVKDALRLGHDPYALNRRLELT